jgi:hypothetical protein
MYYYYSDVDVEKKEDAFDQMMKTTSSSIGVYMTIINHLEKLPQTWQFILHTFKNSKVAINISRSEINFKGFRDLDDDQCLFVYVQIAFIIIFHTN